VALAGVALVGAALATGGGGESGEPDGLRVEPSTTSTEVLVYVPDPDDNVADRADGARTVTVECLDAGGEVLIRAPQAWPFTDTDGETLDPHAHLPLDAESLRSVDSCRLVGTEPQLEGGVG
jgi:hypothetical protein